METKKTKEDVFNILKKIIFYTAGTDEFAEKDSLQDDLGLDSLDIIEILMECEKQFHIYIYDEESEKITTVGQLIDLIYSKLYSQYSQKLINHS